MTRLSGAKRRKVLVRDSFFYVPILATLEKLLKLQSVRKELLRLPSHNNQYLQDFSDGSVYKQHQFFQKESKGLQIVAYYDEVETCNPLGSSSGKFKLGCMFFTLGNIRPIYRSGLKAIFLISIAKSTTIKANGIDSILEPFLKDLKTLQQTGITVTYDKTTEVWKGTLLAILADNLAAHELGGFKESFSFAKKFCRSCLADKDSSSCKFIENQFEIRTTESHADHCSLLKGPDRVKMSIEYGINRTSSLESLPYFSVINGLPHDIMHDLYEGVVPHEIKLLLNYCARENFFDIEFFNSRLKAFDFGYTEIGDKPAPIEGDSRFRQGASQMWLLARVLPLLVGDKVPRDNAQWQCFLTLLKICELCSAFKLSEDSAAYLEVLIEEHHSQFKILYSDASIIPKMHFMIHYPQQIIKYGPLIHTWTMRHEAKLRIIKRAAKVSNFKNVCQSVAKRHQHLLCYYMHSKMMLSKSNTFGPLKLHSLTDNTSRVELLLKQLYNLLKETVLLSTSFVTHNGLTYKPNAFILYSYNNSEPIFAKVVTILKADNKVLLVLDEFITKYYDSHYHAYCVGRSESSQVCNLHNLPFPFIFHLRHTFVDDNKLHISYKYIE